MNINHIKNQSDQALNTTQNQDRSENSNLEDRLREFDEYGTPLNAI